MKKIIVLCLSLLLHSSADETVLHSTEINALITQIKQSDSADKRILMNDLKIKLRALNQASRNAVIQDLRKTFQSPDQSKAMHRKNAAQNEHQNEQNRQMQMKNRKKEDQNRGPHKFKNSPKG